jgi:peptidyl-prolyl cis-trans isomerase C
LLDHAQSGRRSHSRRPLGRLVASFALAVTAGACGRCGSSAPPVAASYDGGTVTVEDLQREASRMPPLLRTRFETEAGRRDLASAIVDKRLLAAEGRRRKLDETPEIRREIVELEERLTIQALLAAEEKALGPPTDAELRAWYDGHRAELGEPERVHVRRILAAAAPEAGQADRERARARAERLAARLRTEPFEKVAREGDGPERARGGDLGLIAKGEGKDPALEAAAFALRLPGDRSAVVAMAGGYAVLELVERRPGRVPSFEEARGEVANRLEPLRKRKAFDDLLARLRAGADVKIGAQASR